MLFDLEKRTPVAAAMKKMMGRTPWRKHVPTAVGLSALCLVFYFLGLGHRPAISVDIAGCERGLQLVDDARMRTSRIFPKPERLCLSAPYNACIDVPLDPEHLYAELLKTCPEGGCTVLDVGANKGDFIEETLKIAPQTKIVAFEPHPLLSQDLERRFGKEENVRLHKAGLSISPGSLHAAVSVGKGYQSVKFIKSCSDITDLQRERYNKTCQTIPTIALDDVVDFPVNIAKVDVQGHELDVLLGGFSFFMTHGADIILSELSPALFESEAHARLYVKLLASRGYRIYAMQQLSPTFRRTPVELPVDGVDLSAWTAIADLRRSGSWMDILCVRAGLEKEVR